MIRLMIKEDLGQCLDLLEQLTTVYLETLETTNKQEFINTFKIISSNPDYYIFVYDLQNKNNKSKIVGMCTIFIEHKFIHNNNRVGHIEDVVVDKDHRYMGIGKKLIQKCIDVSTERDCYKVILNSNDKYIPFYTKLGFKEAGYSLRYDK